MRRALGVTLLLAACAEAREEPPAPAAPVAEAAEVVPAKTSAPAAPAEPPGTTIVISAVGDCTIGSDSDVHRAPGSFHAELAGRGDDYGYPFSGVLEVLGKDDLTLANLETTLTTATSRVGRPLAFVGKPEFVAILREGSVDAVSVANNHAHDFGFQGFAETVKVLGEAGVGVYGYGHVDTRRVKGLEIVNLGFTGGDPAVLSGVVKDIRKHKREDNFVIVSFHWGGEGMYAPTMVQLSLGRASIDAGADLVLGHHPHVLQGIEEYRGRRIVYSLGNFVFGGHSNPADKDSMIYQEVLTLEQGRVAARAAKIIPVRISSTTVRNDYRPVLLEGEERDRVLKKVADLGAALAPPPPPPPGARGEARPQDRRER